MGTHSRVRSRRDQVSVGVALAPYSNRQDRLASKAVCATLQFETQGAEGAVNLDGGRQSELSMPDMKLQPLVKSEVFDGS